MRDSDTGILHRNIEAAMSAFGRDVLTAREQAVVQLILRGLPSKAVASQLKIALKTEKVHRRNAYAKLGVNSHAVLFGSFLKYLSSALEHTHSSTTLEPRRVAGTVGREIPHPSPHLEFPRTRISVSVARGADELAPPPTHAVLRDVRHR